MFVQKSDLKNILNDSSDDEGKEYFNCFICDRKTEACDDFI